MRWRQHAPMLGFVVGTTVLFGIGASGYRTVIRQAETAEWVEHTHRVIEQLDDMLVAVTSAESAVRGFALSHEHYLSHEVEPSIQLAHSAYAQAKLLMRDNPLQERRITALGVKLERRITLLREHLARVNAGGALGVLPESLQLSAELRHQALEMVDEERRLLGLRVAERARQTQLALGLYGVGLGLSLTFVCGSFVLGRREARARQKSERELKNKHTETTLLLWMGELLQATRNPDEAYDVVEGFSPRFFPEEPGAIFLHDAQGGGMTARCTWGDYAAVGSNHFMPDDCWALRRGRQHGVDASGVQVRCRHAATSGMPTSLCMPLMAHGELLGVLHLSSRGALEELQERAAIYAEHLSMALANLDLRERLREEAIRDPLTGLYNRRHTQEALERELKRAARTQEPVAVMMIDVDHFKKFNDNFGHQAGDHVLVELGKLLGAYTRGADVVSRMGGEELLIMMPGAREPDAHAKAEQLREATAGLRLTHEGRDLGSITISVGVSVYPRHGTSVDTLLRSADTALYRAKGAGRDRVVIAA